MNILHLELLASASYNGTAATYPLAILPECAVSYALFELPESRIDSLWFPELVCSTKLEHRVVFVVAGNTWRRQGFRYAVLIFGPVAVVRESEVVESRHRSDGLRDVGQTSRVVLEGNASMLTLSCWHELGIFFIRSILL